jgi:leader peptidase (prepilin peptidase)/N-methyltransferase
MNTILESYLLFWICVVGICLGSFYNVVILRSLSNESIVFPPSKCPKCGERLKFWHNIPVLSYILLGGKCAFCKEKISIQYPLIEITTMLLFAFSFLRFGIEWKTLFAMVICSTLLIMATTDIKEKLVDCNIAIILSIVGILYNWLVAGNIFDSICGLLTGVVIIEIIARIGYLLKKGRALGEADTYVAGALGACFGMSGLINILLYTLVASMVCIVPLYLYKQYKNNNKLICILSILFILFVLTYKLLVQNWYSFSALLITGIFLTYAILSSLKDDSELTYLPLVPAFSMGALYYLFF